MEDIHIYVGSAAVVIVTILSIILVSHIRNAQAPDQASKNTEVTAESAPVENAPSVDFDGSSFTDMGQGEFYIQSSSGSSEDGSEVFFFFDDQVLMNSLGFSAWDFDGTKMTHIYVDGVEVMTEQLANTQGSIELSGNMLSIGSHKVEAVQFENDNVVTYKSCNYEVKNYA